MEHKLIELDTQDPQFRWGGAKTLMVGGYAVGLASLAAAVGVGATEADGFTRFFHHYQVAFLFFLAIPLGCLFFVTLHYLTRAGWSVAVRRLFEFFAGALPVMLLLALPVVIPAALGYPGLFTWADRDIVRNDPLLLHKAAYLNVPFFLVRVAIYFGVWIMMARYFVGLSKAQDKDGDWMKTARAQGHAAPWMIGFAFTLTFATVDFVMSLEPHWYSTIIGVYYFAACVMSSFAAVILLAKFLQGRGKAKVINVEHYHDLGKLLFAFIFFWAYIAFSQYMLIWYANLPEETIWYLHRQKGQWVIFAFILLAGHFAIPFLGLISRNFKRNTSILAFWAGWALLMHWADMFYLVMPALYEHGDYDLAVVPFSWMDPLCMLGVGGIFIGWVAMGMRSSYLVPMKDPRMHESLAYENL